MNVLNDIIGSIPTVIGFEAPFIIISLMAARFLQVNMLHYSFFAVILSMLKNAVAYVSFESSVKLIIVPNLVILLFSFIIIFVIAGFSGRSMSPKNYETLLAGMVFYPWYLGFAPSLAYLFISCILVLILSEIRLRRAYSAIGSRTIRNRKYAKKVLSQEEYEQVVANGSVILAIPVLLGALISLVLAV